MKRRLALALLALAALAVGLPACEDEELAAALKALGEGCLIDSDCTGELVCVFRRCHVECEVDKDCTLAGTGPYCRLGDRPTHVCLLPDEQGCEVHGDCPSELMVCAADAICRDACATDQECLPGQQCLKGACANVDEEDLAEGHPLLDASRGAASDPCTYTSQCLSPLACIFGLCREECIDDRDCPSNAACVEVPGAEVEGAKACVVIQDTPPTGEGPEHCQDGVQSGDETGVDCGGSCSACASGGGCDDGADCSSKVCGGNGVCLAATCSDGVQNGAERGIDCGGLCADGCPTGGDCHAPSDCVAPDTCVGGTCVAPTCMDGLVNAGETDVDCGGPNCAACGDNAGCATAGDCDSLVCAAGTCLAAGCNDGVQNGDEVDVDCGGTSCDACGQGATCTQAADCASGSCDMLSSLCLAPSCTDGLQNGLELGIDCGGPGCLAGCAAGTACADDSDCDQTVASACDPQSGLCAPYRTITVDVKGAGAGTVTSTPSGILCGATCTLQVLDGATVTLDTTPSSNSSFGGFGGDCTGTGPCMIAVGGTDVNVTATFGPTGAGLANWHTQPDSIGAIVSAKPDSQGHVFLFTSGGANFGCGQQTGPSQFSIAKYAPGPTWDGGACVASLIDGGASTDTPIDMAVTSNDDVAVLFEGNGSIALVGHPVQPCPGGDGFAVAWYDGALTTAAYQVTPCYNESSDPADAMGLMPNDDILVVGKIGSTSADFGGAMPANNQNGRLFMAIYDDATAALVEFYQFGDLFQNVVDTTVDPTNGDILLTLRCAGVLDIGGGIQSTNPGGGTSDMCVAKFDASLTPQWIYQVGGTTTGTESGVASGFLPSGEVVFTGVFQGQLDFGDGVPVTSAGGQDIAVVLLDGATGTLQNPGPGASVMTYGTAAHDAPLGLAVVPSGPLAGTYYLAVGTGDTVEGLDLGGGPLPVGDTFALARYDTFGAPTWTRSTGNVATNYADRITDLSVTADGGALLSGFASITIVLDWGSGPLDDEYLARFNP